MTATDEFSAPARLAEEGEGISIDELRLAGRNHAMPLEALRYDITPLGLHYLLIHYDIPYLDVSTWRLRLHGAVDRALTLTLDDLRARPRMTRAVTLECAGNGRARTVPRPVSQPWLDEAVGTAEWTGTPLAPLLREAGVRDDAVDVVFTGADHGLERGVEQDYARALPVAEAMREEVMLAYEVNGVALPPQHGFPLRLLVPGWYGMTHVKWLTGVELLSHTYEGFQNAVAYRVTTSAGDPGDPVTRINPRALIAPPGVPDFMTRTRFVQVGSVRVSGRAWSGWDAISRVEVSVDGGATWADADLGTPVGPHAWVAWSYRWEARRAGAYELLARAHDAAGNVQPVSAWNRQGMACNASQRVRVVVREPQDLPSTPS